MIIINRKTNEQGTAAVQTLENGKLQYTVNFLNQEPKKYAKSTFEKYFKVQNTDVPLTKKEEQKGGQTNELSVSEEVAQTVEEVESEQHFEELQEEESVKIKPLEKTKETALQGIEFLNSMIEVYDNVTIKGDNKYYTLKYNNKTFAIINLQTKSLRIRFYKESLTEDLLQICKDVNGKSATLKSAFTYKREHDTQNLVKMIECGVKYMQNK